MVFYLGVGAKPLLRSAERSYSDCILIVFCAEIKSNRYPLISMVHGEVNFDGIGRCYRRTHYTHARTQTHEIRNQVRTQARTLDTYASRIQYLTNDRIRN